MTNSCAQQKRQQQLTNTHTHHNACRIQNDIINTAVKTSMYDEEEESAVR